MCDWGCNLIELERRGREGEAEVMRTGRQEGDADVVGGDTTASAAEGEREEAD